VFPDEFHLNTLDQLLSAISRLNPHVNIKAIVIGLMDRLSAYAAREAESESSEERKQNEEEATINLLKQLRISKETKKPEAKQDGEDRQTNGEHTNGDQPTETPPQEVQSQPPKDPSADNDAEKVPPKKNRGIPEDVKLYEIFYDQVLNLVNAQRLHIQDVVALLVSLSNLAL
jgi:vacuolar protein sorting-associated protein 35